MARSAVSWKWRSRLPSHLRSSPIADLAKPWANLAKESEAMELKSGSPKRARSPEAHLASRSWRSPTRRARMASSTLRAAVSARRSQRRHVEPHSLCPAQAGEEEVVVSPGDHGGVAQPGHLQLRVVAVQYLQLRLAKACDFVAFVKAIEYPAQERLEILTETSRRQILPSKGATGSRE